MADSETSSTHGENNNLESGKEEEEVASSSRSSRPAVKPPTKKTESWPRFSYTGSLGGTLQVL